MRTKYRITSLLIVIFSIFINNGCTQSVNISSSNSHKKTVAVILKTSGNDYWKTVRAGADEAGKEFGVDISFNSPLNENDIDDQINMVNNAIERKVDSIVLAACDYNRLVSVSEKAIKIGIPVIIIDSALNSSNITSFIATDNKEAAIKAASKLVEIVGQKCNIAIMGFVKGAATSDEREEGINQVLKKYKDIKILDREYSLSDENIAEQLTKNMIKKFPNLNAIIALNGPSATGTARAIEEMNLTSKIKVVGFDNTEGEVDYLEEDAIQATVIQNPYNIGYLGVKYAYDVINKISVPKTINTGSTLIDKSNMYLSQNQKLLFPFVQ